ncbi:MAG: cytochrome c oxidase subunit II [Sphingomonas sp. SCN 67-18]|uniref:cytochrome c oxidase subunit II n=1 Tax=uncultured Sphingomonas sp. TaxID=158754 RepID=UPI00086B0FA5|nr:cytochrome c oxidase subunit II [Sphingomonas sp. SCN 67-18]ODU20672.1 MAG: cytochrome c oxidase subunit II [Sphingomonas sp. SCN 67-18]
MTMVKSALLAISLIAMPGAALAQDPAPVAAPAVAAPAPAATPTAAATPDYTPLKPVAGIGEPIPGGLHIPEQVSTNGREALRIHNHILMPIITAICVLVLVLLFWAAVRYRRSANPIPSKTSHNTLIEVAWTLLPVLILVGIAVPSISLLAAQYKPPGKDALTVKAIGNQWYWTYEYPDNGGIELVSNMLTDEQAKERGEPRLLGVDNRLVLPVGRKIKLIVTSNDVIHSFAVPAFWAKMDAVPGRLNELSFTIEREGVYYGQCSELCGARHGFMPIAVEAVSPERYAAWVKSKGGSMPGEEQAAPAADAGAAAEATADAAAATAATNQAATGNTGN